MIQSLMLAAAALSLVTPRPVGAPGEVTGVSVLPGAGRAHMVIDVRGDVTVQDFTLTGPPRLVVDVVGATLRTPRTAYDGVQRGGVLNIRQSQFRPDVVRIVFELESLKDYELEFSDEAIRISFGADRQFQAWSSSDLSQFESELASAPPAAPESAIKRPRQAQSSQQPRISVTWENAPLADVVAGFSAFSGKSIILGRQVTADITAEIKDQPWDLAFASILESQDLTAVEDPPGIINVISKAAIAARDSTEPVGTRLIPVNFARATSLVQTVQTSILTGRGKVSADTASNTLIVTDGVSRLDSIESFVGLIDRPAPQISIQAKLIFVNRTDIENLGVRYDLGSNDQFFNRLVQRPDPSTAEAIDTDGDGVVDAVVTDFFDPTTNIVDLGGNSLSAIANAEAVIPSPALQLVFATAIGSFDLTTFVEALQQVELADLQAEPVISTSDNTTAQILVGDRTPIRVIDVSATGGGQQVPQATVQFVETGILLNVTPHVTNAGQVLMRLRAENSSIREAPADLGFTFQTQEATSEILVGDGETAVIGGLTVTQLSVSKSGIPFLVDLPLVGKIFGFSTRREERRDLLILVTPHIIDPPASLVNQ